MMQNPSSDTLAEDTIGVAFAPWLIYGPNTCDPNPPVALSGVANCLALIALITSAESHFSRPPMLANPLKLGLGAYGVSFPAPPTIPANSHGVPLVV